MKIYFAGSIRGGRDDVDLYIDLINYLKKHGEVLTEHVGNKDLLPTGEKQITDRAIHDRDLEWLEAADVMIAEVTSPSLGVGYEIAMAYQKKKKILCLYRPQDGKRLSGMIGGCPGVEVVEYQLLEEARVLIDKFFT